MQYRSKQIFRVALLGAGAAALLGCQSVREAAGLTKEGPDEFAVVTKAPLIVPPDYNLRPPRDGAPPANQIAPTDSAQSALFASDPSTGASMVTGDFSQGEKLLLAYAGAVNPDPAIRQQIASDGRSAEAANDDFTSKVLFWQDPKTPGTNVDAEAEDKRLAGQKAAGQAAGQLPPKKPTDSAVIDNQESKGGWLDGIF